LAHPHHFHVFFRLRFETGLALLSRAETRADRLTSPRSLRHAVPARA
jgi:hypothetical protein